MATREIVKKFSLSTCSFLLRVRITNASVVTKLLAVVFCANTRPRVCLVDEWKEIKAHKTPKIVAHILLLMQNLGKTREQNVRSSRRPRVP